MERNSCDESTATNSLVDHFYGGAEAFHNGKAEADIPLSLCDDEKHYWLTGFRSSAHHAANPCISVYEYEKVAAAAHRAGSEDRANGVMRANPFCPEQDSERNDIWDTVYSDGRGTSGFKDFKVLGIPRQVINVS
jgi:hypothetical protein